MYSFEGQYRRIPQQNLSGASVTRPRDEFLQVVRADRLYREKTRDIVMRLVKVQAYAKGFLIRRNLKRISRERFDSVVINSIPTFPNSSKLTIEYVLSEMTRNLIYFYSDEPDDEKRLATLMHNLILNKDCLLEAICNRSWLVKLKQFLSLCVKNMAIHAEDANSMHYRSLELFLSIDTYRNLIDEERASQLLLEVYQYLMENDYYRCLRELVDARLSSIMETKVDVQNFAAITLASLIDAPIKLIKKTDEPRYRYLVYSNLIDAFMYPKYTIPVKVFVLPHIRNSNNFSFHYLVEAAFEDHSSEKTLESSWLLRSLLKLETTNFLLSCEEHIFQKYLELLSYHSRRFQVLHDHHSRQRRSGTDLDEDSDDDNVEKQSTMAVWQSAEIEILTETAECMTTWVRVDCLVNRFLKLESLVLKESVVCSLANSCYSLIQIKPRALYEFKLLTRLAVVPSFLYDLWTILNKMERTTLFGTPKRYLNLIAQGVELDVPDINACIPMLTAFCYLFLLFSYTLDDTEFLNPSADERDKKLGLPFNRGELLNICETMKAICVGLIEMAFPDTRRDLKSRYLPTIFEEDLDEKSMHMLESSFRAVVLLVQHLYARDLRCQFTPENMWISNRLQLMAANRSFSDIDYIINRRVNVRPFSGMTSYSRNNAGLSYRDLQMTLIMEHVPFMVSFEDRVVLFQNCVLEDKIAFQGEVPYNSRFHTVEINIRRNFLYEDAFEKLSMINEPELRHVFRVQMKSAIGVEELGIDGGGVFREFLSELLLTAFDPNRGFFCTTSDNYLYPNPHVELIHPDFCKHYFFIGRMLGKALYENLLVELPLALFFLSKLSERHSDLDIHHLASLDPLVYKNLLFLKNYQADAAELGLDFTIVNSALGTTKVVELKRDGANIPVTNENKLGYIYLVADYKLNKQISRQYNAFKEGLINVIRPEWLHMFSSKDLQILISGAEVPIDIVDLRTHVKYSGGFTDDHHTISLFWAVLEEFDDPTRKLLLKFVTSCSKPPLFGFKELDPPFCIQNVRDCNRLPTASTCMNLLKMPPYDDYETLRNRLLYSIKSGAGFELS